MRLVAERLALTQQVHDEIAVSSKITRAHLDIVKELLSDELESRDKSQRIAETDSYNDQYRKNMRVAVNNSEFVIQMLEEAISAIKRRDSETVTKRLRAVVEKRGKRAAQPRTNLMSLYGQYLAETDPDFQAWLAKNGHSETTSVVATPKARRSGVTFKPARASDGRSNNPEDY